MSVTDERAATDPKVRRVLTRNIDYIKAEVGAGRQIGLRFLRFRPARELRDTLEVAEDRARGAANRDETIVDIEAAIGQDWAVDVLRDAIKIHAPAAQVTDCPPGYVQPPYPLNVEDRERLYDATARILQDVMSRHLPGGSEGWAWRVEPQVTDDGSALILRLTPRNERFEDPITHAQTPTEQAAAGDQAAATAAAAAKAATETGGKQT